MPCIACGSRLFTGEVGGVDAEEVGQELDLIGAGPCDPAFPQQAQPRHGQPLARRRAHLTQAVLTPARMAACREQVIDQSREAFGFTALYRIVHS